MDAPVRTSTPVNERRLIIQGQLFDSWAEIEWQLYSSVSTRNGYDGEGHEWLLNRAELDHREANYCEHPI